MVRSVAAYKGGYIVANSGATDLDRLLGNFVALLDHVAAPLQLQADTAPALGGNLDLRSFRILSSISGQTLEIVPAGTGGFRLNAAGQAVGAYGVDLQRYRTVDSQTASGQFAFTEGACNTASAVHSHAEGYRAIADQYGAHTESTSDWIGRRAQRTDVSLCGQTANGASASLSADGVSAGLTVPANVTWLCEVHLLAVMDYGYTSAWVLRFAVQNNGVNAHIVSVIKDEDDTLFNAGVNIPTPSGSAIAKECAGAVVNVSVTGSVLTILVQNPYETTKHCGTSWHADFHITELSTVASGGSGSAGTVI
jgi:hypothetical protein